MEKIEFNLFSMKEEFRTYLLMLINGIPQSVYEGLLSILCIGFVVIFAWKGKNAGRFISRLALLEYSTLLYCITVFFRVTKNVREYNLTLFWSYEKPELFVENVMNVVVFVSIGFLFGTSFHWMKWWMSILIAMCISLGIETLQFIFKKGFSEIDDVTHNTLGCVIGIIIFSVIKGLWLLPNHNDSANYN